MTIAERVSVHRASSSECVDTLQACVHNRYTTDQPVMPVQAHGAKTR
jgi:hypothetical protein